MILSVDQLRFMLLHVGFAQHDGDWNWKHVRSPFARLYYVTEGKAQVGIGSHYYTLTPGHLYFIPAFTEHSYVCKASFSHYYVHIYEDQERGMGVLEEYTFPVEVDASPTDLELVKRLCDMNPFLKLPESNPQAYDNHPALICNLRLNQQRPFHDKMESRGILYILMSRFFKQAVLKEEVKDNRIHQTMVYIRKHLDNHLGIDMLADKACMSKDHYIRVFKKETGETPNVYITKRRLERAELALATSELSVKGIAQTLGYEDHSYFNRVFKQNAGVTPQQYREKYQK
ncbi:MAG: helix-turn-helix transcriptional regulator [Prevotella sp.]|nr:helix-turn-helix transcriptional regulator [Prevotella sp.]